MTTALYIAALSTFAIGIAHSVLGERYILMRLFRRDDLPKLFGSAEFTVRTLRFAWHLTTIAWWGYAVILILLARQAVSSQYVSAVLAGTFLLTGLITVVASKGKHFAWPVFLFIGSVCLFVAST